MYKKCGGSKVSGGYRMTQTLHLLTGATWNFHKIQVAKKQNLVTSVGYALIEWF